MATPKWVFQTDESLLSKRHDLLSRFTSRHRPVSMIFEMAQDFKWKSLGRWVFLSSSWKPKRAMGSTSGGMMTPTWNEFWMSRQMLAHKHQEGVSFMTYLLRLSGESRAGSQAGPKLAWGSGEWRPAWLLLWLGGSQGWRFLLMSQSLCSFNFPVVSEEGTWAFLSAGPAREQKGRGQQGVGPWKLSAVKHHNGAWLYITPLFSLKT